MTTRPVRGRMYLLPAARVARPDPTALNLQDFCPVVPDFLGDCNEVGAG